MDGWEALSRLHVIVLHNTFEHLWVLLEGSLGSNPGRARGWLRLVSRVPLSVLYLYSHSVPCSSVCFIYRGVHTEHGFLQCWGVVVHSMQGGAANLGEVNTLPPSQHEHECSSLAQWTMGTLCEPRGKVGTYNC